MSILRRLFGLGARSRSTPQTVYSVDPVTLAAAGRVVRDGHCACLDSRTKRGRPSVPNLHAELQDPKAPGWDRLREVVRSAVEGAWPVLEPSALIPGAEWAEAITLPAAIGEATSLKELRLYGSHLRRLPPEIGRLAALESLDLYTSYSLHWLPYEVTRCERLRDTRISTRALYGNANTLLPFPRLSRPVEALAPATCSVCDRPFGAAGPQLFWTTLAVGTDRVPLLIHSCSEDCTRRVPDATPGYPPRPHKGGGGVGMPVDDRGR